MKKGIFKLDLANIKSAIVYGFLTIVVTFILSITEGVINHGSIFGVDWSSIIDTSSIKILTIFVAVLSIIKNLLTASDGKFLGIINVVSDKKN